MIVDMVKDSTPPFKYIGCRREALVDSAICLDNLNFTDCDSIVKIKSRNFRKEFNLKFKRDARFHFRVNKKYYLVLYLIQLFSHIEIQN